MEVMKEETSILFCTKIAYNSSNRTLNINILYNKTDNCTDHSIDLSYQKVEDYETEILAFGLEENDIVRKLDISWNQISARGAEAITECLLNNRTLLELNMSGTKISNVAIAEIINQMTTLEILNVSYNNISKDGVYYISICVKLNTTLKELNISNNNITSAGARWIAEAIGQNKVLQKLDISHNDIQDDGSILIGEQLKFNTILQELNISANNITDIGAMSIAEPLYVGTALCKLDISCNSITCEGLVSFLEHIQVNTTVKTLLATHNNVTKTRLSYIEKCIKKMCASLIIHTSWNEMIMFNKRIVLKVNYVSFNTESSSKNVDISDSDPESSLHWFNYQQDMHNANILSDCLMDNNTLQELNLSNINNTLQRLNLFNINIKMSPEGTKRIIEVLQVNTTLIRFNISMHDLSESNVILTYSNSLIQNNTLQELSIAGTGITKNGFKMIINALRLNTTLLSLDVSCNSCLGEAIGISSYLKNNTTLKELYLKSTFFGGCQIDVMMKVLSVNTALQKLVISNNYIGDVGAAAISRCLKHNNSLKILHVSGCFISNVGIKDIAEALKIKANIALQKLDISWNGPMTNDSLEQFDTCLKDNHTLKKLDLSNLQITSEGIQQIIQSGMTLKQLNISNNKFNNEVLTTICDSLKSSTTTIKKFCISNVTTAGIKMLIEALSSNHSLQKLDISANNFSDDGADAISAYLSKSTTTLLELNISCNNIKTFGVKKIVEALKNNSTLRKLDISCNPLSDDGAAHFGDFLKENNTLIKLDLSNIQITMKSVKTFAEAIQANTSLKTLKFKCDCYHDAVTFNMAILDAMHINRIIMKLILPAKPWHYTERRRISNKVSKIYSERLKHGVNMFYTNCILPQHFVLQ